MTNFLENILSKDEPVIKLQFEISLPSEANIQEHWVKKMKRKKVKNAAVRLMFNPHKHKVIFPCLMTLTRISPRSLDDDNLVMAFKSIRDELVSLLMPDKARGRGDEGRLIQFNYNQKKGPPKWNGILIEVYNLKENHPTS